jgi:glucosamine 6-phosphate synthetase-like amidotransferase/phosphosugar isomerase protein
MCGIAAIFLYPQPRPPQLWQEIKSSLTENLRFNEERGAAATGLALLQADGQITLHKQAIPARQFIDTPEYAALLNQLGPDSALLLGHTRRPTKGAPLNPQNNHPLHVGPLLGVHNGHIHNDDQLFARLNLPRQAQVDSEIIFRLMAPFSPGPLNGRYLSEIRPQMQQMKGQFTFLAADQRAPHKLLVVRHQNPLSIYYHPHWNALVFSSSYIFLRKSFGRAILSQTVPQNQLLLFETATLPTLKHHPAHHFPLFD